MASASDSQSPPRTGAWVEMLTAGRLNIRLASDGAEHAADQLGGQVGRDLPVADPAEDAVGERDDRVEVAAGDRTEARG